MGASLPPGREPENQVDFKASSSDPMADDSYLVWSHPAWRTQVEIKCDHLGMGRGNGRHKPGQIILPNWSAPFQFSLPLFLVGDKDHGSWGLTRLINPCIRCVMSRRISIQRKAHVHHVYMWTCIHRAYKQLCSHHLAGLCRLCFPPPLGAGTSDQRSLSPMTGIACTA